MIHVKHCHEQDDPGAPGRAHYGAKAGSLATPRKARRPGNWKHLERLKAQLEAPPRVPLPLGTGPQPLPTMSPELARLEAQFMRDIGKPW